VALDDLGRPVEVPPLKVEGEDELRRFENAKKRIQMKKDRKSLLQRK